MSPFMMGLVKRLMRLKDLSAYKITNPMPRLELDEVAISDGDLCGSVFLDKEFLEHVEKKVGSRLPEAGWFWINLIAISLGIPQINFQSPSSSLLSYKYGFRSGIRSSRLY